MEIKFDFIYICKSIKKLMGKFILGFSICLMLFTSCASKKDILFFQDISEYESKNDSTENIIKIKKNDLLSITVSSIDRKSAVPFNLPALATINSDITAVNAQQRLQTYLVDNNGEIQFPILGNLTLEGKSTIDAINYITEKLKKYIKNPIVNLRITNFKISVLGEVRSPGVFNITDQRITILEALSRAGDMTVFGKRKDVIVIREENGEKTYNKLDFTSKEVLKSPYYYLQQNDIVVVSPNNAQIQSSAFNRNTGIFVSIAGVIISVITILTR